MKVKPSIILLLSDTGQLLEAFTEVIRSLYTCLQSVGIASSIRNLNARGLSAQCIGSVPGLVLYRPLYA